MQDNLWDDHEPESTSTPDATVTTTDDDASGESPLAAAIAASSWTRGDVELALQTAQVVLLAVWVAHTYTNE